MEIATGPSSQMTTPTRQMRLGGKLQSTLDVTTDALNYLKLNCSSMRVLSFYPCVVSVKNWADTIPFNVEEVRWEVWSDIWHLRYRKKAMPSLNSTLALDFCLGDSSHQLTHTVNCAPDVFRLTLSGKGTDWEDMLNFSQKLPRFPTLCCMAIYSSRAPSNLSI